MASSLALVKADLDKAGVRPIYLVQGEERLLVDQAVRAILTAAAGDPDDPMAVTRLDLAEGAVGAREVIAACRAVGLFTPRATVLARGAQVLARGGADTDALVAYATSPEAQATLVLVADKLKGTTKLVKRVAKQGKVWTFDALRSREVPNWVLDEATRLGHRVDVPTARLIGELVGTDLGQLRLAVDKLSLYVGPGQPLTADAAETLLASTRAHSVFELVDAVGERQHARALTHLRSMLEHREQPLRILGMLIRHFRMLWQVAAGRAAGRSLDQLTAELRLHPFQARKLWAQSQRFDEATLRRAYELLFEADLGFKSSRLAPGVRMEQLVLALCGPQGGRR